MWETYDTQWKGHVIDVPERRGKKWGRDTSANFLKWREKSLPLNDEYRNQKLDA